MKDRRTTVGLASWAFLVIAAAVLVLAPETSAYSIYEGVRSARGDGAPGDLFGAGGVITTITNVLLFVIGALAVIMIIVGGLRYVVSGGNATAVSAAKNTILYAIVGLIVAFLAFAAVNFVLGTLMPGSNAGYTDV
jgi:hypothetical protein